MKTVTCDSHINVLTRVHDSIAFSCDYLDSAVRKNVVCNTFVTLLEVLDMFRIRDPVKVEHRSKRLIVCAREEDLSVAGFCDTELKCLACLVLEAVNCNVLSIVANKSLKVSLDRIITVSERIIPVVLECTNVTSLHHVVFCSIA